MIYYGYYECGHFQFPIVIDATLTKQRPFAETPEFLGHANAIITSQQEEVDAIEEVIPFHKHRLKMPQPWYGQPPVGATGVAGNNMHTHHQGYHRQAGAAAPGGNMSNYGPGPRTSPTNSIVRPPSSASISSFGSMSYNGNHSHGFMQPSDNVQSKTHQMYSMPGGNHGHQAHPSHGGDPRGHHNGVHHVPARYPMTSHSNNMHPMRPVGRGHFAPRSQHPMPPQTGQPLRQLPNGNNVSNEAPHPGANQHVHYVPSKPQMNRAPFPSNGHPHHGQAYRPQPGPGASHGVHASAQGMHSVPYNHNPRYTGQEYNPVQRQNSFMPVNHMHGQNMGFHQRYDPSHRQRYPERPMHESPSTIGESASLGQSPSPPPPPPANRLPTAGIDSKTTSPASTTASSTLPKAETPAPEANKAETKNDSSEKNKSNDDDDAASILLQLSGLASQAKKSDGSVSSALNPSGKNEGTVPTNISKPSSYPESIELSSSLEEDATVTTADGIDSAPDLTSEPSSDSMDQKDSDFPAAVPENYPKRLALPYDETKLNSLHCFLRSELLEIFVVQKSNHKSPTHSPGSSVGRVGLRCVHCAMVHRKKDDRDEAPMAVFYPKSVAEIYRLVTSWQRCHLRKCKNLPPSVRSQWQALRENDKSRGKTHYWVTSAKEIGLVDSNSRAGGIRFGPNTKCTPAPTKESSKPEKEANTPETQEEIVPGAPDVAAEESSNKPPVSVAPVEGAPAGV